MLASVVLTTVFVIAACTPPRTPEQEAGLADNRYDSLVAATAHDSGAEWRADKFPSADLHAHAPRPALPAGADTNDPTAYLKLGVSIGWREPGLADRAFYWATRLDPTMAEAYYARWDMRRHGMHFRLFADDSVRPISKSSPNDDPGLDSLRVAALMYDPFLAAALDIPPMIRALDEVRADRDPATSGFRAYAAGDYSKAVRKWGEAIRQKPANAGLHVPRAFAWMHLAYGRDSAIADITALIDRIEHIEDSTVGPYISKDYLYYAVGFLRAGQKRYPEARAAYESALAENLGFYMAHIRLAAIDLALHDTTAALTELETASLMRTDDPLLLTFHGQILLGEGRLAEAQDQLRAAVHVDTDFALPYAFLGRLAEQLHDTTKALSAYREYLARAIHGAAERGWAEDRVTHLTSR